jgi:hypothetical protein
MAPGEALAPNSSMCEVPTSFRVTLTTAWPNS